MKYYMAPMEGITGYIFRNACHKYLYHMDKYFTPFITPTQTRKFKTREVEEVLPEHNQDMYVVPQILTNKADDFIWAARELEKMGYREINLNLGCPSGTVVAKKKGSGFLADQEQLDIFFGQVFSQLDMKISVKTRIGKDSPDEFQGLMEIYNKYPFEEVIIHPRIQKDFYNNHPDLQTFQWAYENSLHPLCYNGDIRTGDDYKSISEAFPNLKAVMIGRGILRSPGLMGEITGQKEIEKKTVKAWHDEICKGYCQIFSGDRNVLFKMKEIWFYLMPLFSGKEGLERKLKKAKTLTEYQSVVEMIFESK